ncbi:hypothetical protein Ancab_027479 [Ancistrocladus abbreviatus]
MKTPTGLVQFAVEYATAVVVDEQKDGHPLVLYTRRFDFVDLDKCGHNLPEKDRVVSIFLLSCFAVMLFFLQVIELGYKSAAHYLINTRYVLSTSEDSVSVKTSLLSLDKEAQVVQGDCSKPSD